MGAIARALANSITTGGVVQASAINNTSVSSVTALPSGVDTGDLVLISSQTASSSASIEFTSGLDSTYDSYVFKFINIHPATDDVYFQFNLSTDGGSNYNVTKTTTSFEAYHNESDSATNLRYATANSIAGTTISDYRNIVDSAAGASTLIGRSNVGTANDAAFVGLNSQNATHAITHDAANEDEIAGYAIPINGLTAFID